MSTNHILIQEPYEPAPIILVQAFHQHLCAPKHALISVAWWTLEPLPQGIRALSQRAGGDGAPSEQYWEVLLSTSPPNSANIFLPTLSANSDFLRGTLI